MNDKQLLYRVVNERKSSIASRQSRRTTNNVNCAACGSDWMYAGDPSVLCGWSRFLSKQKHRTSKSIFVSLIYIYLHIQNLRQMDGVIIILFTTNNGQTSNHTRWFRFFLFNYARDISKIYEKNSPTVNKWYAIFWFIWCVSAAAWCHSAPFGYSL